LAEELCSSVQIACHLAQGTGRNEFLKTAEFLDWLCGKEMRPEHFPEILKEMLPREGSIIGSLTLYPDLIINSGDSIK